MEREEKEGEGGEIQLFTPQMLVTGRQSWARLKSSGAPSRSSNRVAWPQVLESSFTVSQDTLAGRWNGHGGARK